MDNGSETTRGPLSIRAMGAVVTGRPVGATIDDDQWLARQWALTQEGRRPAPVPHVPPKRLPGWVFFLVAFGGVNVGLCAAGAAGVAYGMNAAYAVFLAVCLVPLVVVMVNDWRRGCTR